MAVVGALVGVAVICVMLFTLYVMTRAALSTTAESASTVMLPMDDAQDFTWTTDTRVVRGSDEFGFVLRLGFRIVDEDNYTEVVIDPQASELKLVQSQANRSRDVVPWTASNALDTVGGVNRITIRAFGQDVLVYVNGSRVLQANTTVPTKGKFGIGLRVAGAPPAIRFDNVLITTPGLAP